jgi:hypothetical protein
VLSEIEKTGFTPNYVVLIYATRIAGFLFLLIIVLNVASVSFGNELMSDLKAEAKLQRISEDPTRFKTGIGLAVAEHFTIIALAVSLFVAFSSYDKRLGWVWLVARSLEGLILMHNTIKYARRLKRIHNASLLYMEN